MPEVEPTSSELTMPRYGSYRVLHPLGSGGMSSVYRAVHVETGHEFALKVLPVHLARNPVVLQRFMREARSAESLQHPNIVSIYDRGVDGGRHYLVLEFVDGTDLHAYVQMRGPLGAGEAVRVIREVAEGLRHAAGCGLVHRDIKPSNILRSQAGVIKITDLGLALQWEFEDERVTRESTTVGTVDYMAPEQARDSRAAGPLSDQYSLGCTLYYILTGIPPFPGGDIVDKLTRHAQSQPPDVRDLRPDVPEALSRVMIRMMAKRAEDRFPSFDELIQALDAVPIDDDRGGPAVALVPLESDNGTDPRRGPGYWRQDFSQADRPPSSIPEISLALLPPDLIEPPPAARAARPGQDRPATAARNGAGPVVPRSGVGTGAPSRLSPERPAAPMSAAAWIGLCVSIGACIVLLVVAVDRLVRPHDFDSAPVSIGPYLIEPEEQDTATEPVIPSVAGRIASRPRPLVTSKPTLPAAHQSTPVPPPSPPPEWVEPEDHEDAVPPEVHYSEATLKKYLPAWALAPVPRGDGPTTTVRRVPGPGAVSLRAALDEIRSTVEIADEGPFLLNDPRIPGESRVIRAREGCRPIVRIDRPVLPVVRAMPAVIVLEGKNLVLDSLDLIVNLRDLAPGQTALFACSGSSLTLRNCTISLVNPGNQPFTLVACDPADGRGCRIRIENSLIRGSMARVFDLGRGPAEVVVRDSFLLGSQGPVVHSPRAAQGSEHRLWLLGSVAACRGPAIQLWEGEPPGAARSRPLLIRAFRTVLGRFQGAGIASVVACESTGAGPRERLDWQGDSNLFCGWKGFYAAGQEPTLILSGLDAHRSTWNGSDGNSQAIPVGWPLSQDLGLSAAQDWLPFVPGWEAILGHVARPRPFLGAKTVWSFPPAFAPQPLLMTGAGARPGEPTLRVLEHHKYRELNLGDRAPRTSGPGRGPEARKTGDAPGDLEFDADSPDWHGDLGAFLREKLRGETRHARVRVQGSGPRRASPVRLPDGVVLEILVEPPPSPDAEWLSWSPDPDVGGAALFELRGGALVLSGLRLRDDASASIESLIQVEEGDLVLHRCRLAGPPGPATPGRRLLTYKAALTRPRAAQPPEVFANPPDRHACILTESSLTTPGPAIRAEVGRGLLALSQTALASGGDAIELVPARVARARFLADLVLDHCTLASETNIVRLRDWPGLDPAPDRPWLIQSERSAFLGTYDRRVSDTVLLRSDPEAMARGLAFWQGSGDAVEVDRFTAMEDDPPTGRNRDVVLQWVNFWGSNHQRDITGPRAGSLVASVRLLDRPKPGRVEPADLFLDPTYHPGRPVLDVGADLSRQGIVPRPGAGSRRRIGPG